MWSPPAPGARCAGAGDPRSSLECVSRDRGGGGASLAMPGMRGAGRKDRATTVQGAIQRSEEHTSELQSLRHLVCRLLLEKKKKNSNSHIARLSVLVGGLGCTDLVVL